MPKWTWAVVVLVPVLLAAVAVAAFRRDMAGAYERIGRGSQVARVPQGEIEFALGGGGGLPVLVVHGSGGGFDQGALLARAALGDGWRWIAPSRFGYLRSTFRAGATFDDQADAYACLLDHLGIGRVAVVALSHGGPSALLFAARHPQRVASLTLISAGVAAEDSPAQQQASRQGDALTAVFQQDWRYWVFTKALRKTFLGLMGVDGTVAAALTPEQRQLADEVIDGMNPVSRRAAGTRFDNRAAMPDRRIAAIRAPTLVLHARDDTLQLFRHAEFAAAHIPGARLMAFDRGGHLLLAVEREAVKAATTRHIVAHPGDAAAPGPSPGCAVGG